MSSVHFARLRRTQVSPELTYYVQFGASHGARTWTLRQPSNVQALSRTGEAERGGALLEYQTRDERKPSSACGAMKPGCKPVYLLNPNLSWEEIVGGKFARRQLE
jgi:hypothetical protein